MPKQGLQLHLVNSTPLLSFLFPLISFPEFPIHSTPFASVSHKHAHHSLFTTLCPRHPPHPSPGSASHPLPQAAPTFRQRFTCRTAQAPITKMQILSQNILQYIYWYMIENHESLKLSNVCPSGLHQVSLGSQTLLLSPFLAIGKIAPDHSYCTG